MTSYPRITTAAALFNGEMDKVVLIKREGTELFPNTFALPGGRLESGESLVDGIRREIYEETGLDQVSKLSFVGVYQASGVIMTVFVGQIEEPEKLALGSWVDFLTLDSYVLAPNVKQAIESAKAVLVNEAAYHALDGLPAALEKAYTFIAERVVVQDEQYGWGHYLTEIGTDQPVIGVIGTSLGILSLAHSTRDSYQEIASKAVLNLLKAQHENGGWGTKSISALSQRPDPEITESTAYALWALSRYYNKNEAITLAVTRAIQWLTDTQKAEGGWSSWNTTPERDTKVTPTSLVLIALSHAPVSNPELKEKAVNWLIKAQHRSGGWGQKSQTEPTAPHTGRALFALTRAGLTLDDEPIRLGMQWLRKNYRKWNDEQDLEIIEGKRLEFKHGGLQWGILGLISATNRVDLPEITQSLYSLMKLQTAQGGWLHSMTGDYLPIWATFDAIQVIQNALSFLPSTLKPVLIENLTQNRQTEAVLENLVFLGKELEKLQDELQFFRAAEKLHLAESNKPRSEHIEIFISYRRDDTSMVTGRLYERLREHFGPKAVFLDVASVKIGEDFVQKVASALDESRILIAVIGTKWFGEKEGQRRIDDAADLVRREIFTALQRGNLILPLYVDDMVPLAKDQLPQELERLANINGIEINARNFGDRVQHLIGLLDDKIKQA